MHCFSFKVGVRFFFFVRFCFFDDPKINELRDKSKKNKNKSKKKNNKKAKVIISFAVIYDL